MVLARYRSWSAFFTVAPLRFRIRDISYHMLTGSDFGATEAHRHVSSPHTIALLDSEKCSSSRPGASAP
jgi:hypothetical protein